jgi:hypothetical protein
VVGIVVGIELKTLELCPFPPGAEGSLPTRIGFPPGLGMVFLFVELPAELVHGDGIY